VDAIGIIHINMKLHSQLVLIEFYNSGPFVERFTSKRKITLKRVVKFIEKRDDPNWDKDGISFVDDLEEINLDKR